MKWYYNFKKDTRGKHCIYKKETLTAKTQIIFNQEKLIFSKEKIHFLKEKNLKMSNF